MQADILREKFLEFFSSKGHRIMESDSLVPKDDPTVLFTPAGMNQFKREFLGYDSGFKRAATSQRCLRTDDLDKVGKTKGHHTFFEMLGNFSFGDYFKKEAILWSWEFLTCVLKIKKERLWVSVYKDDDEAYRIWVDKAGLAEEKIVKLGDKDNFWPAQAKEKGPNGPCGPCSEIFYDFGRDTGCRKEVCNPACDCGRFVEIWNLVFTQFNRKDAGMLEPLPNKNIDTGMGLERLTAVMEGKQDNFQTELFQPLIQEIMRNQGNFGPSSTEALYAVADHIRAVTFSIFDGVMPSNEGRGYVIRKIIRKSTLHLRNLGIDGPFLNRLVPIVAGLMHSPYPELKERQEAIASVVLNEENNFINTLNSTERLFKDKFFGLKNAGDAEAAGKVSFELYDTYGIPLDLSKEWLKKEGIGFSEEAFTKELNAQKERSRIKSTMKGDVFGAKGLGLKIKETEFSGYNEHTLKARIKAILKDGKEAGSCSQGELAEIILDKTCFFPESGGQVGDTGELKSGKNIFEVLDTQKADGIILHAGKVKEGVFTRGDAVVAAINSRRRLNISCNHTATHILQAALRKVLGSHVQQQGSLVAEEKLRFDFTHFKGLSKEELEEVEEIANNYIGMDLDVEAKEMDLTEAKKTKALAFFGEKYGQKVRVVSVGEVSLEFCGGAHLKNTRDIGLIKIVSESSVASGIRRIEGVTGDYARAFAQDRELRALKEKQKKEDLLKAKDKKKQEDMKIARDLKELAPKIAGQSEVINGINLSCWQAEGLDMDALRRLMDFVREKASNSVIALGSNYNGRAFLVVAVTLDLLPKGFDALKLIAKISPLILGKGGGRNDFAQAGGLKPENFTLAFKELRDIIVKCPG